MLRHIVVPYLLLKLAYVTTYCRYLLLKSLRYKTWWLFVIETSLCYDT